MKTLRRIERFITAVAVVLIGRWLYVNFDFLPIYYFAYPTDILLGIFALILLISGFCFLEIILNRRIKLRETFEVFKPVEKLTPDDFRITKYNEFYIERESDTKIETLLRERKYVFITGIPMLGKTRMAYKAVKKLKGFYLLKPKYERIDVQKLKLPLFKKKIVLFLDDLNKYLGKFNPDDLIRKLKEKAQSFVVVVSCRSGKEFEAIRACKEMETLLTQCQKNKIEPRLLQEDEEQNLAEVFSKNLSDITSDGTPGSITIDLRYMKQRCEDLGDEKFILKSLKLLRESNIFLWKENLVKEVSKGIFDLNIQRTKWDSYVNSLSDNGFIMESSGSILISHDVYLDDRFLDDYFVVDDELIRLKESLTEYKDADNLFYLSNAFYFKENQDQSLKCLEESIQINPAFAGAHYNLGILFGELKRYEEAEKEYREALRINPDYAEAHCNLGVVLDQLKRYADAEREYKMALEINNDLVQAHHNLGLLLYELKRYGEAEKEYREALRINSDYTIAHGNLGILLYELKRYEEAEKELRETLRINPVDAKAHSNLGVLLYELKRYDEAEKEYKEVLRINPDDAEVHAVLGYLFYKLKRHMEAEKEYKEALRINPEYVEVHNDLGILLYGLKRYEEAEKEYNEGLQINFDNADMHYNLGILLMDLNRKAEAKKEFEIARDLFRKQEREEDAKKAEGLLEDL